MSLKSVFLGLFGIMRLFYQILFWKILIFLKGKLVFSDVSNAEKKLFEFRGKPLRDVINEKFHNRLSFSLNIIEP